MKEIALIKEFIGFLRRYSLNDVDYLSVSSDIYDSLRKHGQQMVTVYGYHIFAIHVPHVDFLIQAISDGGIILAHSFKGINHFGGFLNCELDTCPIDQIMSS